jgi:hypothetical protein
MEEDRTSAEVSASLFGNMYMARLVVRIGSGPTGEQFTVTDIHERSEIAYPLVLQVMRRLVLAGVVIRHPETVRNGSQIVPYTYDEKHAAWGSLYKLCQAIAGSEVEKY